MTQKDNQKVPPEVSASEAARLASKGAILIDLREPHELSEGSPRGSLRIPATAILREIRRVAPELDQPVITLCAAGIRSRSAAQALREIGYRNVQSVVRGYAGWLEAELPTETIDDDQGYQRYSRQILLPEIGTAGQDKLRSARILIVGAGGLGSPAALYLAAAGVGTIGIVDQDRVELTNLHRQILHGGSDIGQEKTSSAQRRLNALNPTVDIVQYPVRLSSKNVESIIDSYDLVIDGSDNFPTRYLISDACVHLAVPHIYGAVERYSGQVSVFWPSSPDLKGPCYRCLFPEPPPPELAPSCADAGVLGVVPGIVGISQATEALKLTLGLGKPLVGRLLLYSALESSWRELSVNADPVCKYCGDGRNFPGYIDYEQFCNQSIPGR